MGQMGDYLGGDGLVGMEAQLVLSSRTWTDAGRRLSRQRS